MLFLLVRELSFLWSFVPVSRFCSPCLAEAFLPHYSSLAKRACLPACLFIIFPTPHLADRPLQNAARPSPPPQWMSPFFSWAGSTSWTAFPGQDSSPHCAFLESLVSSRKQAPAWGARVSGASLRVAPLSRKFFKCWLDDPAN